MARGMIPADLFRIQWVSDVRIASDGRMLAFTVTRLDEEADDYRSAIWVVPADGSAPPRRFTSGGGKDSAPRWSPDGTRLAFLSDRDGGKAQVYVMDVTGGEARKLSAIPRGRWRARVVARWHATRQRGTYGGRRAGEHAGQPQAQNAPGTPHHRAQVSLQR